MHTGSAVALLLLAHSARAITITKCEYRVMEHVEMNNDQSPPMVLTEFKCQTDEDLYMKSVIDPNIVLSSLSTQQQVDAALNGSSQSFPESENFGGMNFAGVTADESNTVANALFSYAGNVKLVCGAKSMPSLPSHFYPTNHIYMTTPIANPMAGLWQGFGAYKFTEPLVPRSFTFLIQSNTAVANMGNGDMSMAPTFTPDELRACSEAGNLKVVVQDPPASLAACTQAGMCMRTPGPCNETTTPGSCYPWKFADSAGTRIAQGTEVAATEAVLSCDVPQFNDFASDRLPKLFELLDTAQSREEQNSAAMTYTTITNAFQWQSCQQPFDSFFTTKSVNVVLPKARVCTNSSDPSDPCCSSTSAQRQLRWSDCCLPVDRDVTISGVFDAVDTVATKAECGAAAENVNTFIGSAVRDVLMASRHPEKGCAARNAKILGDTSIWSRLGDPVNGCFYAVLDGKTKQGQDTCNTDEQCWSNSCVSQGSSEKRCAAVLGGAAAEAILDCALSKMDPDMIRGMSKTLGLNPARYAPGASPPLTDTEIAFGVDRFRDAISTPSCTGAERHNGQGWCTIDLSQADCARVTPHDYYNALVWVPNTDSTTSGAKPGFCKRVHNSLHTSTASIHIDTWYGPDAKRQEDCKDIFTALGGFCTVWDQTFSSEPPIYTDQTACSNAGGSWVSYDGKATKWYQLASVETEGVDPATGNRFVQTIPGDQTKCEMEKTCNWDPEGRITSGNHTLCLNPSLITGDEMSRIPDLVDSDGDKATCLRCWGSRCEEFHDASPSVCAAVPHRNQQDGNLAAQTGGGPDGLEQLTAVDKRDMHYRFHRPFTTQASCLDQSICPVNGKHPDQAPWDDWMQECGESMCVDLTLSSQSQCEALPMVHGEWKSDWAGGNGLCRLHWNETARQDFHDRGRCESWGKTWWEGRAFRPAKFYDAASCQKFCENPMGPPTESCGDIKFCDSSCPQCKTTGWPFEKDGGGACVLTSGTNESHCQELSGTDGYEWAWDAQECFKKGVTTEAACAAADGNGRSHEFFQCYGRGRESCMAFCWLQDYTDRSTCESNNGHWKWDEQKCESHHARKPSSSTCESFMDAIDSGSSDHERYQAQEACWRAGCTASFDPSDGSGDTCTGTSNGCDQQAGGPVWIQGSTTEDASTWNIRANLLRCEWRQRERCPTQQTCEASGECNDYDVGELGSCLFRPQRNDDGYREGCDRMGLPLGCAQRDDHTGQVDLSSCEFRFDWGDGFCALTQNVGGTQRRVLNETLCDEVGGQFKTRAESEAECTGYGKVCTSPFNSHDVFGGITTENKCQTCGYRFQDSKTWRSGRWAPPAEQPLSFAKRVSSSKNTWDPSVPTERKFRNLVQNSIASIIAESQRDKITCELAPYQSFIPIVNDMCNADAAQKATTVASYSLAEKEVPCDDMKSQSPAEFYEGSVDYADATCANASAVFQTANVKKTVVVESSEANRRRRRLDAGACAMHRTIRNAAGATVGQTVGSGVTVNGVSGATVCLNPTVPTDERCSEYAVKDVVSVSSSGVYSAPLEKTITVDSQGKYCIDSSQAGVTYVPVHLQSDWKTVAGPPQAPTPATPSKDQGVPSPSEPDEEFGEADGAAFFRTSLAAAAAVAIAAASHFAL
jgi:hypothetical protein